MAIDVSSVHRGGTFYTRSHVYYVLWLNNEWSIEKRIISPFSRLFRLTIKKSETKLEKFFCLFVCVCRDNQNTSLSDRICELNR